MSTSSSANLDIHAKYQKLAGEYTKLRAQVPVLKKAVVEEQSLRNELQEELQLKDQSLRKLQAEVESLTFRNRQLGKRVELLQDRLDEFGKRKPGKDKQGSQEHPAHDVLEEELQNKLSENENLHKQMYEMEEAYLAQMRALDEKVKILDEEASNLRTALEAASEARRRAVEAFKADPSQKVQSERDDHPPASNHSLDTTASPTPPVPPAIVSAPVAEETPVNGDRTEEIRLKMADMQMEKERLSVEVQLLRLRLEHDGVPREDGTAAPISDALQRYYGAKIGELTLGLQATESEVVYHRRERAHLLRNAALARIRKTAAEAEVDRLKDELETTRRSYEAQLVAMSELVADLNLGAADRLGAAPSSSSSSSSQRDSKRSGRAE